MLQSRSTPRSKSRLSHLLWAFAAAIFVLGPIASAPGHAQSREEEQRLRKLEQEVRALQRKVFPGDSGRYFEPEITAPAQPSTTLAPDASGGAVTDLLARMDAVEAALAQLTAQSEVNANALRLLNARVDAIESAAEAASAAEIARTEPSARPGANVSATDSNLGAMSGQTARVGAIADTGATPDNPSPQVQTGPITIERPMTDDLADDTYVYGFRLWDAGLYGDAREQLNIVVETYPAHRRASWARNLIGRAYLDEGKPRQAAEWFLKNYLENRDGERAPDSLVYLAIATLRLGNAEKACEALDEFRLVYPAEAGGRLSGVANDTAASAGCS